MDIKYTNIFLCKTLQNLPKFGFLVWKYTIWQPCGADFRHFVRKEKKTKERKRNNGEREENNFSANLSLMAIVKLQSFGSGHQKFHCDQSKEKVWLGLMT
jgi:hypothetical protein